MSNYSPNEGMVRANLFKPSGKWSGDWGIDMSPYYNEPNIHDAVRKAVAAGGRSISAGWRLVVLDPYHMHAHPIMIEGQV